MRAVRKMLTALMSLIPSIIFTQEEDGNFLLWSLNDWFSSPSARHQPRDVISFNAPNSSVSGRLLGANPASAFIHSTPI